MKNKKQKGGIHDGITFGYVELNSSYRLVQIKTKHFKDIVRYTQEDQFSNVNFIQGCKNFFDNFDDETKRKIKFDNNRIEQDNVDIFLALLKKVNGYRFDDRYDVYFYENPDVNPDVNIEEIFLTEKDDPTKFISYSQYSNDGKTLFLSRLVTSNMEKEYNWFVPVMVFPEVITSSLTIMSYIDNSPGSLPMAPRCAAAQPAALSLSQKRKSVHPSPKNHTPASL